MDTLDYLVEKYNINLKDKRPIIIPNVGRDTMAGWFRELGFKVGAEVGVLGGSYSEVICKANPGVKLYCVDPWEMYEGYVDYRGQGQLNKFKAEAEERLAPYNCVFVEKYSMDAVGDFEDESLDFVYIDANHNLKHVISDLVEWTRKVKPGGIVAGHDYFWSANPGNTHQVIPAIQAYTSAYKVDPWFVLGRHKTPPGEIRDKRRSWMFIK